MGIALSVAGARPVAAAFQNPAGSLTGIVVDSLTSAPLPDVLVRIDGHQETVTTEADGTFRIDGLGPGVLWLEISLAGYGRARQRVDVRSGEINTIRVALIPGATPYLETIEVRPGVNPGDAAAPASRSLDAETLRLLRGVLADDPFRAVQVLPGVAAGDDFRSEFSMRGSDSRHLGMSMDGIAIPWPLHAVRGREDTGSIAVINSDAIDRITVEAGSYAQRAGTRTGGWIDFSIRDGSRARTAVKAAASVTNASVLAEGSIARGRGSWLATVRRSYLNWLLHQIDADTDAAALGFLDHQARVVLDLTSRHQLQVSTLAGRAGYDEHDETPGANSLRDADSETAVVIAGVRSLFGITTVLQRVGYVSQGFQNMGEFSQVLGDGRIREWVYNVSAARRFSPRVLAEGGAETRNQHERRALWLYARDGAAVRPITEDSYSGEAWLSSAHAQITWEVTPEIVMSPGVRVSHSNLTHRTAISPWLQARWRVGRADMKLGAGLYPQFADFDQVLGASGGGDLRPESALHADLSASLVLGGLRWQAAGYYRREQDMLRLDNEPRAVDSQVVTPALVQYRNALDGSARGIELSVEGRRKALIGWISYSYGRATYRDQLTGERFDGDYDQRHTVNLLTRYQLARSMAVGAQWRYGSNVPVAGYFGRDAGAWFLSETRNASRFPVYSRFDVRADRSFTVRGGRVTLFAEVINVFNRTNLGPADPSIRARTLEVVRVTETLMPRVPAVGVVVDF